MKSKIIITMDLAPNPTTPYALTRSLNVRIFQIQRIQQERTHKHTHTHARTHARTHAHTHTHTLYIYQYKLAYQYKLTFIFQTLAALYDVLTPTPGKERKRIRT